MRLVRAGIGVKLGGRANNPEKKKLRIDLWWTFIFNILPSNFFFTLLYPPFRLVLLFRTVKMDTESDTPQGITSSADRMVGMEHSEVRYFTRYVILHRLGLLDVDTNNFIAMTTTVNYLDQRWRMVVWFD